MQKLASAGGAIQIGDTVRVRAERWVVHDVRDYEACAVITLSGAGERNLGLRRRVLSPFEPISTLPARRLPVRSGPRRWQRSFRAAVAAAGPACRLQTAASAQIDLLPHQLEPALALIRGDASRLLIADAVGLGKTIQAGLAIAELLERRAADRVLVLCPAGLRDQWRSELLSRFRLTLWGADAQTIGRARAELPPGVSAWSIERLAIASIDYVKRPEVLPAVLGQPWDIVVVDEAHHAASQSERRRAVEALCNRAPHVILLTATPHNGDAGTFDALCRTGAHDDRLLVFRRTRTDVGLARNRRVHLLQVCPSPLERLLHARLAQFARALRREHGTAAIALGLATLEKRALSSPFALEQTVRRRLASIDTAGVACDEAHQLALPWEDAPIEDADAAPAWTLPMLADRRQERDLLGRLAAAAVRAQTDESKLSALERLLRRVTEPVVIFTEYRDTLIHVRNRIGMEAACVHGGLSSDERRAEIERFIGGGRRPARILLATDAAGEGLNLHTRCRVVVNLELPWSPVRLEQRLGRVDRLGQARTVHAFHFIAARSGEDRVLARLRGRIAHAAADAGTDDPLSCLADGAPSFAGATRLIAEASVESQRIATARALITRSCPVASRENGESGPPIVARARGRIRSQLRGRMLVVLRSDLSDRYHRVAASHLTPVLLDLRLPVRAPEAIQALLDWLVNHSDDRALAPWREATLADHERYWRRRLERERLIASGQTPVAALVQPGLFDQRALRAAAAVRVEKRKIDVESAHRLERLAGAVPLILRPFRPVLVLLP